MSPKGLPERYLYLQHRGFEWAVTGGTGRYTGARGEAAGTLRVRPRRPSRLGDPPPVTVLPAPNGATTTQQRTRTQRRSGHGDSRDADAR
jgi:hypothetical protein